MKTITVSGPEDILQDLRQLDESFILRLAHEAWKRRDWATGHVLYGLARTLDKLQELDMQQDAWATQHEQIEQAMKQYGTPF